MVSFPGLQLRFHDDPDPGRKARHHAVALHPQSKGPAPRRDRRLHPALGITGREVVRVIPVLTGLEPGNLGYFSRSVRTLPDPSRAGFPMAVPFLGSGAVLQPVGVYLQETGDVRAPVPGDLAPGLPVVDHLMANPQPAGEVGLGLSDVLEPCQHPIDVAHKHIVYARGSSGNTLKIDRYKQRV